MTSFCSARRSVEFRNAAATPASRSALDLILHQRDQRRDDEADAVAHERRDLIAQRLAAARRHQHERVAPGQRRRDDGLLLAAEARVAEHVAQDAARAVVARRRGGGLKLHAAMMP